MTASAKTSPVLLLWRRMAHWLVVSAALVFPLLLLGCEWAKWEYTARNWLLLPLAALGLILLAGFFAPPEGTAARVLYIVQMPLWFVNLLLWLLNGPANSLFSFLAVLSFGASIWLAFRTRPGDLATTVLGFGSILLILIVLILFAAGAFLGIAAGLIGSGTGVEKKTCPSPQQAYTAEITAVDTGAAGGGITLSIRREGGRIPLLFGEVREKPLELSGRGWSMEQADFEWLSEDSFRFQNVTYSLVEPWPALRQD